MWVRVLIRTPVPDFAATPASFTCPMPGPIGAAPARAARVTAHTSSLTCENLNRTGYAGQADLGRGQPLKPGFSQLIAGGFSYTSSSF